MKFIVQSRCPKAQDKNKKNEPGTRITNIFPITLAETKIICKNNVRAWLSPVFSSIKDPNP